jgi:RNA polymerase sigma-70 factor (ECF subfamily)
VLHRSPTLETFRHAVKAGRFRDGHASSMHARQFTLYRIGKQRACCFVVKEKNDMQQSEPLSEGEEDLGLQRLIVEMENVLSSRRDSLFRCAYKFLGNAADADDAVQDALLSAYKHLGEFRGESQMSTWLTTIVKNSALMQLRGRSVRRQVSLDDPIGEDQEYSMSEHLRHPGPSPEDECRISEFTARVAEIVPHLSLPLRKAFELRDLGGLTIREAARILGVGEGTLKAQLSRARTKMRGLIRRRLGTRNPRGGVQRKQLRRQKPYSSNATANSAT